MEECIFLNKEVLTNMINLMILSPLNIIQFTVLKVYSYSITSNVWVSLYPHCPPTHGFGIFFKITFTNVQELSDLRGFDL